MPAHKPGDQTDDRDSRVGSSPGTGLSRRRMLQGMGAAAGAAAFGMAGLGRVPRAAAATPGTAGRTGTIADLKHVVVLMQENRSYDHYFATLTLPGSAGFADKQAVLFNNGQNIFYQPDSSRSDGFLLPYRLNTTQFDGQYSTPTMGYYEPVDLPWHHALAHAYTVGDHYHCSLQTDTDPNRVMLVSGTNDPEGGLGGPVISDLPGQASGALDYTLQWETYAETLQNAGVSWQWYCNTDLNVAPSGSLSFTSFFGFGEDDLELTAFAAFNPANANPVNTVPRQGLLARGNVLNLGTTPPTDVPNAPSPANVDYVLKDFIADCAAGLLPEVSWISAPDGYCEHPGISTPDWGALYVNRIIQALHDNPELWNSTLFIIDFDENNPGFLPTPLPTTPGPGFFDHILRPVPEAGTPGEGAPGLNPGLGQRVPLILVSPWTRGGWVAKETFDHTSTIQFMEKFTTSLGKPAISTNISAWRRSVTGDLTSAIDFTSFDNSFPELPDPVNLLSVVTTDLALPAPPEPPAGEQTFPVQTASGPLKLRPAPYQQNATIEVDRSAGTVTATMSNPAEKAASMQVFPGSLLATPFTFNLNTAVSAVPNTVSKATGPKTYTVDTTSTDGQYDFAIYGPDHFVRSFTGTVIPAGDNSGQVPDVSVQLSTGKIKALRIALSNEGDTPVTFTLTPNDYEGQTQTVAVRHGEHIVVDWPTNSYGYYDLSITADASDGFTQRYAGKIS